MIDDDVLLDERTVLPYLAARGIIDPTRARARQLGGGVSNVVLAVDDGRRRLVLKQARGRLQVADEWYAPRERIVREAEGLGILGGIDPSAVPEVVDLDAEALTLTIQRAPEDWTDWKLLLLGGSVEPAIAARLGGVLARMQRSTVGGALLPADLANDEDTFELLRLAPYHRTVARRNPELAADVLAVVERMRATRSCLVHGDFSPKNVLVGRDQKSWVIDFEVAHLGDPTFDPAFLVSHLLLKALHRSGSRDQYAAASAAFFGALAAEGVAYDVEHLSRQIGCLVLARVDGKSPAEYLLTAERRRAHELGSSLLTAPVVTTADLWVRQQETSS